MNGNLDADDFIRDHCNLGTQKISCRSAVSIGLFCCRLWLPYSIRLLFRVSVSVSFANADAYSNGEEHQNETSFDENQEPN